VISAYRITIENLKFCRKQGKKKTGLVKFKECSKYWIAHDKLKWKKIEIGVLEWRE
jgi:hypothetical protein